MRPRLLDAFCGTHIEAGRAASTYQRERRRAMGTSGFHWPLRLHPGLVEVRGLGVLIAETFRWGA